MLSRVLGIGAAAVLAASFATGGCATSAKAVTVTPGGVEEIAKLTGEGSINHTDTRWQVVGTDLGIMWDSGHGTMLQAFGDTYGQGWGGNGGGPASADWRCQTMAVSTDHDPSDGITFDSMVEDTPGHARQLLDCKKGGDGEATVIPTAGVSVGGRQYLHFMSVHEWGAPGHWTNNYGELAYSDDGGRTWTKDDAVRWAGDGNFAMAAFTRSAGFVYMFGTPSGRYGGAAVARVPERHMRDLSKYQYWTGGEWVTGDERAAKVIVPAPVGELSVAYNSHLKRWLMVYLNDPAGRIVLRSAAKLTGPWSEPKTLVTSSDYPGLYGGFVYPWALSGDDLYFVMSQWGPYNTYLMHTRLSAA